MKIDSIVLRELRLPLVRPFETSFGVTTDRRILLAEVRSEGLTGWGECTAGEHPFFSAESTDTVWQVLINELAPMLAASAPEHGGACPKIFRLVRGNRMAKATLENAIWDIEAQREGVSLSHLLGGVRDTIPCGVSLGIQPTIPDLMALIERELRLAMRREGIEKLPIYPEERQTAHPTAEQVFRLFSLAQRQTLTCKGVLVKTFVEPLTPLQEHVLGLLGIPAATYLRAD